MSATRQRVQFTGSDGSTLAGRLAIPAGTPVAWALFAHCFTCGKDVRAARRITDALAGRGVAVLSFDFTGLGESDGDFADSNFSSNVDDLVAAADFLRQRHTAPHLLVGHSLGGSAVVAAAKRVPETRAVAVIGAPCDPAHVTHHFADAADALDRDGVAEVVLAGRPFTVKRQLLEDLAQQRLEEDLGALRRALLILHSPQDNTVGIGNAECLYLAARHPKSFVTLDGADHLLTRPADAAYVGDVIACWATRYLDGPTTTVPGTHGEVFVHTGPTGYATEITASGHHLRADEPVSLGGTDTGPTPYDLLLSALGACTSITLRMYADRKGWPLRGIDVKLGHHKIHARDCDECEDKTGMVDDISRRIRLTGELDDDQRRRLLQIADRCPVHRTLHGQIRVRTDVWPE